MFSTQALDASRLPEGQIEWVDTLVNQLAASLQALTQDERSLYKQVWKYLATHQGPAAIRQIIGASRQTGLVEPLLRRLHERKLLWFDSDLRAVLQCPPFSVLSTPHQVKAFGWERAQAVSFFDLPTTLLIYGPNVWVEARSVCARSGEPMVFQLKMTDSRILQAQSPPQAEDWRVWLPIQQPPLDEALFEFIQLRSRINAFYTPTDLATHQHYQTNPSGVVYTFDQALYLANWLLYCFALL
jgi:hypothetical protein